MLVNRKKRLKLSLFMAAVIFSTSLAWAESPTEAWFISGGWQNYHEPQMHLRGPELGIHMHRLISQDYAFEAEGFFGYQNYSSLKSGKMNNIPNINTNWLLLRSSPHFRSWQYGVAFQTHHNFFHGTTSLGFGGYGRHSAQIWLPVRWQLDSKNPWIFDAGWLLMGKHVSRLSQANSELQNIENGQKRGAYFQVGITIHNEKNQIHPFIRLSRVHESDKRLLNFGDRVLEVYEPSNTRLQLGVKFRYP